MAILRALISDLSPVWDRDTAMFPLTPAGSPKLPVLHLFVPETL